MPSAQIDPEFERIAKFVPREVGKRPVFLRRPAVLTTVMDRIRRRDDLSVEQAGGVTVRVHRPPVGGSSPVPAVLWLHGGGFIGGSPAMEDGVCRDLARELGALVVAPEYRLAPEHPFPAALHDAHDALVWLAARDDVDADRIVIAGASAGGGLAAQLALLAAERGEVRPVLQALVYPMLDDRTTTRSDLDTGGMRVWGPASNRVGWAAYLGQEPGGESTPTLAAPVRHDELSGLPPAWIGVGTLDLFHDEDVAYAERLNAAGVRCELVVVDGVFHAFDRLRPKAAATTRMFDSMLASMRAALDEQSARRS